MTAIKAWIVFGPYPAFRLEMSGSGRCVTLPGALSVKRLLKHSLCQRLERAGGNIERCKQLIFRARCCGHVPQERTGKAVPRLFDIQ